MKRGRKRNIDINKKRGERISIIMAPEDMAIIRKAVNEGKLVSISETIRTGLRNYLNEVNISKSDE